MIERNEAKKIVAAFSGMPFYPSAPEAITELINAVERFAESETHAKAIKEELIYGPRCPTPGEIRATALSTKPKEDDFHYEPPTPEEQAENAKWAEELAAELKLGADSAKGLVSGIAEAKRL